MKPESEYLLSVSDLSKSFAGVKALANVRLNVRRGEVHALMGENGAGKSTLMKMLIGLHAPDAGEIRFDGEALKTGDVKESLKRGIAMIHQEILAVPELTVAQNIFLGREDRGPFGWLNDRAGNRRAEELLKQLGTAIDVRTPMKYLSVAEMQMVEIAKAISNDARIIIMDEPTSALSDREVAALFRIIRELKQKGVAIIYISHKMDEIFEIADTITVLRDGKYVGTGTAGELDRRTLITMMVGREIDNLFPEAIHRKGREALSVRNLSREGKFADISFELYKGEVLGMAGLMGAGRTEIARVLCGLDQPTGGEIFVKGKKVYIRTPQDAIQNGIGYVSEDRKALGFIPGMSVRDNITLGSLKQHTKGPFLQSKSEDAVAARMMADLKIKASGPDQKVVTLSGGNQQKVVIGKVLLASPEIVILDEPTRGIDVGAKFEIYKLINQLASGGIAVIMISSELPEILGMSDRVLVLSEGRQTALLSREEATQETIMHFAMHA
ncbi:sugar ABC transporter ATP-binding protein [Larkinella soli]|uniref:sugar ABC transporter ATP-binding protein n=1 Tax=Larkinella soli TaxID=1770527 RepID=UPI000FFB5F9D|nr:sugar ABC transporter ATP-binding protein [Larkinella soli]